METILYIDNQTSAAKNAAEYAAMLADKLGARLLIWKHSDPVKYCVLKQSASPLLINRPQSLVTAGKGFVHEVYADPCVDTVSKSQELIAGYNKEPCFHRSIADLNVSLIVMGIAGPLSQIEKRTFRILAYSGCPLLAVPENVCKLPLKLGAYLCDMRFCRTGITRFMDKFCERLDINVVIAQVPASGLPPVMDDYSKQLFNASVMHTVNSARFSLIRIGERNVQKVADVLVNTLHVELLALAYRRYHFYSLTASDEDCRSLHCPLLLFPL